MNIAMMWIVLMLIVLLAIIDVSKTIIGKKVVSFFKKIKIEDMIDWSTFQSKTIYPREQETIYIKSNIDLQNKLNDLNDISSKNKLNIVNTNEKQGKSLQLVYQSDKPINQIKQKKVNQIANSLLLEDDYTYFKTTYPHKGNEMKQTFQMWSENMRELDKLRQKLYA